MEKASSSGVCREFFDKFPIGKERRPGELVNFMLNHPSSGNKLDAWLRSAENERFSKDKVCGDRDGEGDEIGLKNAFKCSERSIKERELGNAHFKKKNLKRSLHHYNEAIKFATFPNSQMSTEPVDSDCLAIALANRSAVYNEIGGLFYDNALNDADLALKHGYPERLKTKILLRKTAIHIRKLDLESAKISLNQLTQNVPPCKYNLPPNSDGSRCCDIHEKIHTLEIQIEKLQVKAPELNNRICESYPDEKFVENEDFENAASNVVIGISKDLGRHVLAKDNLEEGELLFKEESFASVLLPEFYSTHCHHCHVQLTTFEGESYFFPCRRCSEVMFCSSTCSEAAELYHNIECGWLQLLHAVGIAHLALRIILLAGLQNVKHCVDNPESLTTHSNLRIFMKGQNNYHRVYSLLDHIEDMFEEDLFQYTLTASLLMRFLTRKSTFFNLAEKDDQLKVGGALLRHICQLICNAHAVTDILPDSTHEENLPTDVVDEYQKRIATAIFPAASIMNHSCNPNISFHFEGGKRLIVKAARPILAQENVYNCYGPHFCRKPRSERQEILLQQYFFECHCDKCLSELEYGLSYADQFNAFKCQNCENSIERESKLPCSTCNELPNVNTNIGMYNVVCDLLNKGEYLLQNNKLDDAVDVLESCYEASTKILYRFNSEFGKICGLLARCYTQKGNPNSARKYLKESLSYVEARFGNTSVEYKRELMKCETL